MNLNDYQILASKTAIYSDEAALPYLSLGLCSEAGEFAGKIAKWYRKDNEFPFEDVISELGDVLWFVSEMARLMEVELADVAIANIEKLADRQERGVLKGSGDNR